MIRLLCLLLAGLCLQVSAEPPNRPVPGGIARIELTAPKEPVAHYQGSRVMVRPLALPGRWQAIVGIPLGAKAGVHELQLADGSVTFEVGDHAYETQHLTLANKRQVNPEPEDLRRIQAEKQAMDAVFATFRETPPVALSLLPPVSAEISSSFGLRRYFNGEARSPHSGVDLAPPRGTPVKAPASGLVAAVGDYFFNGRTVLIDHGQGMVTMYCHLQDIAVRAGDAIRAGDLLGTVGQSGRATGPHLHWSLSLNNARIDPLLLLDPALIDLQARRLLSGP